MIIRLVYSIHELINKFVDLESWVGQMKGFKRQHGLGKGEICLYSSHPRVEESPKISVVHQFKLYVSWVQNVVRQFSSYLLLVLKGELQGANPSMRGLGQANLWCTSCYANSSTDPHPYELRDHPKDVFDIQGSQTDHKTLFKKQNTLFVCSQVGK